MRAETLDEWADRVTEEEWDKALVMYEADNQPDERRVAILLGLKSAKPPEESFLRYYRVDDHFETVAYVWDSRDVRESHGVLSVSPLRVAQRGFHTQEEADAWVDSGRAQEELNKWRSDAAAIDRARLRRAPRREAASKCR